MVVLCSSGKTAGERNKKRKRKRVREERERERHWGERVFLGEITINKHSLRRVIYIYTTALPSHNSIHSIHIIAGTHTASTNVQLWAVYIYLFITLAMFSL